MKNLRQLLTTALSVVAMATMGQSAYQPLVVDGRMWVVESHDKYFDNDETCLLLTGDTIIDGHQAKKGYLRSKRMPTYNCAMYEEDHKVYVVQKGEQQAALLYDFSLQEIGDTYTDGAQKLVLDAVDYVTVNDTQYRRLRLKSYFQMGDNLIPNDDVVWVEGIGSSSIMIKTNSYTTEHFTVLGIMQGSSELFSDADFERPAGGDTQRLSVLEDGKEWVYRYTDFADASNNYDYRYYLDGDTVIFGLSYRKLYRENGNNDGTATFAAALFEVGKVVFRYDDLLKIDLALYDFSGRQHSWANIYSRELLQVATHEPVTVQNITRDLIGFRKNISAETIDGFWAEGIGSCVDFLTPQDFSPRAHVLLKECRCNGHTLFELGDFGMATYTPLPQQPRLPYHPMLKEGKQWLYQYHHFEEWGDVEHPENGYGYDETVSNLCYVLRGDTVINGESAHKMYVEQENGSSSYYCAWIERDQRVYYVPKGSSEQVLYFDFSLKCDQDFVNAYEGYTFYLHHTDTLTMNDMDFNFFHFFYGDMGMEIYQWMEGVGKADADGGILFPIFLDRFNCICDYQSFVSCTEDGKQIYPQLPDGQSVVDRVQTVGRTTDERLTDLMGRRLPAAPQRGLYIRNGRKYLAQ